MKYKHAKPIDTQIYKFLCNDSIYCDKTSLIQFSYCRKHMRYDKDGKYLGVKRG